MFLRNGSGNMEILIQSNKSYKNDYHYVWDKTTNFIVYQKSNGDIILGTIEHGGVIEENEIKKLYEISLQDFDISQMGYGYARLHHTIFQENFYRIAGSFNNYLDISYIIKRFILDNAQEYINVEEVLKSTNDIKFTSVNPILSKAWNHNLQPAFWKIDKNHAIFVIEEIISKILEWFYEIGKKSLYLNATDISNIHYEEEYAENQFLYNDIVEYFVDNRYAEVENREEDISKVYDQAIEENKKYDNCIQKLKHYVEKLDIEDLTEEENKDASKNSILYKMIVGKYYPFYEQLEKYQLRRKRKI